MEKIQVRPHQVRPLLHLLDTGVSNYEQRDEYGDNVMARLGQIASAVSTDPDLLIYLTIDHSNICGSDCLRKSPKCDVNNPQVRDIESRHTALLTGSYTIPMRGYTIAELRKMSTKK